MATQNESNEKPRQTEVNREVTANEQPRDRSANMESDDAQIVPFSENDPFRAARIAETARETGELLETISCKAVGFEELDDDQIRRISEDAEERARWRPARQDGFRALLRLGRKSLTRYQRIF